MARRGLWTAAVLAALLLGGDARAGTPDAYLSGYAQAVLERELGVQPARVEVVDGVATVHGGGALDDAERARVSATLASLAGIEAVRFEGSDGAAAEVEPAAEAGAPEEATDEGSRAEATEEGFELLPPGHLFAPLEADPRWPQFSASFQRYVGDDELRDVAAVSFGDVIPLVRHMAWGEARWELALHAAVFSIFDIDAESFDLLNSDFLVGPALDVRKGRLSGMLRVYHQSSHLGDEFLLRGGVDRINLSYEAVDALLSWDVTDFVRIYAGGGWLLRRDPDDLKPGSGQAGLELRSPRTWGGGHLRPVFALDVQSRQENGWDPDLSARLGLQIESPRLESKRLQILLAWYQGRSPNGQFFQRDIEYWGLGAHLHF